MKLSKLSFSILAASATCLVLTSCGQKTEKSFQEKVEENVIEELSFSENPLMYPSTHTACLEKSFNELSALNVYQTQKMELLENLGLNQTYDTSKIVKNSNFLSGIVKKKLIRDTISVYVDDEGKGQETKSDSEETTGQPLVYCHEQELKRETVEHVAMNVVYTLDQSFQTLNISGNRNLSKNVLPITLYSHPAVETKTIVYSINDRETPIYVDNQTMTDNAFYYNNGLYFIPHSQEYRDYVGDKHVNFWELPFVGSHEYGHHIFKSYFPSQERHLGLRETIKTLCFEGRKELDIFSKNNKANFLGQREATIELVLSSFNEGFADSFAFYTLNKPSGSLQGVFGFENEREVDSIYFGNMRPKIFDEQVGRIFFSTEDYSRSNLGTFQDSHTIGAIFANVFDQLLNTQELNNAQKINFLLNWLEVLNEKHPKRVSLSAKTYMELVIKDFMDLLKKNQNDSELTPAQSEILNTTLSYFFN